MSLAPPLSKSEDGGFPRFCELNAVRARADEARRLTRPIVSPGATATESGDHPVEESRRLDPDQPLEEGQPGNPESLALLWSG
jgi:hypothetical protein